MPVLEIKHWMGGTSPYGDRGIEGSAKFTSGVDIRRTVDSLTCQQGLVDEGLLDFSHSQSASISPSPSQSPSSSASHSPSASNSPSKSASPSASASRSASKSASPSASASPSSSVSPSLSPSAGLNNIYVDLVIAWAKASDGNTYGFGNTGHIYRRYSDSFTRDVYQDTSGGITGAVEKPSSGGKTYLQWATGTSIKRKPLPGAGDWSDVEEIANNLTGGVPHTMAQVGGANYIANGSFLALVGYDDSYTNEALDLVPGNIANTILERNGRAVIGTYKAGYPNKGINGAIDAEQPLVQVGTDGHLYYADFINSMPVRTFPGGGQVNPGGVANDVDQIQLFDWEQSSLSWINKQSLGNLSLWGVFNATAGYNGVYSYGRKNKDQPITLNLEYALEVDEIGAIVNVDGTLLVSYKDGSSYGVKAVDPDNKATGIWEGLEFKSPVKKEERPTIYTNVEIFMKPLPAGCSVKFFYKKNKTGSFVQCELADSSGNAFTVENGTKAVFRISENIDIYEPRLVLTPYGNTAPEIFRLRTYFN